MSRRGFIGILMGIVFVLPVRCGMDRNVPEGYAMKEQPADSLHWQAEEVVRVRFGQPQRMIRVRLTGANFPHRALEAFVLVDTVRAQFVEIAEDGRHADAYFDPPLPDNGPIVFGYGREVLYHLPR